jgi:O-acetyl-ADP-ribose deacetylase (regulator of RNase III)
MTVTIVENGDIFAEPISEMLVCPVNLAGTMGKGLALEFKERYGVGLLVPYYERCRNGWPRGSVFTLSNQNPENPKWIVCYPTKYHWSQSSNLIFIQRHMPAFFDEIVNTGVKSISIPALGCGLGNLKWKQVKEYLLSLPFPEFIDVRIFAPLGEGGGNPKKV